MFLNVFKSASSLSNLEKHLAVLHSKMMMYLIMAITVTLSYKLNYTVQYIASNCIILA